MPKGPETLIFSPYTYPELTKNPYYSKSANNTLSYKVVDHYLILDKGCWLVVTSALSTDRAFFKVLDTVWSKLLTWPQSFWLRPLLNSLIYKMMMKSWLLLHGVQYLGCLNDSNGFFQTCKDTVGESFPCCKLCHGNKSWQEERTFEKWQLTNALKVKSCDHLKI